MQITVLAIVILLILVILYCNACCKNETFEIDPNIVGGGDFHVNAPGTFADDGSFTDDM